MEGIGQPQAAEPKHMTTMHAVNSLAAIVNQLESLKNKISGEVKPGEQGKATTQTPVMSLIEFFDIAPKELENFRENTLRLINEIRSIVL